MLTILLAYHIGYEMMEKQIKHDEVNSK